jgi:two-component sensor histidine kinase
VHICISYVSEFSSAKVLREFIDEICTLYNISMKWRTRLVLIVDELNNNAIEYGSKKGDTNFLEVHIKRGDKKNISFCARVQDTGN